MQTRWRGHYGNVVGRRNGRARYWLICVPACGGVCGGEVSRCRFAAGGRWRDILSIDRDARSGLWRDDNGLDGASAIVACSIVGRAAK